MFRSKVSNTNAWNIPCRTINLPSNHDMTLEDLTKVVGVILDLLKSVGGSNIREIFIEERII